MEAACLTLQDHGPIMKSCIAPSGQEGENRRLSSLSRLPGQGAAALLMPEVTVIESSLVKDFRMTCTSNTALIEGIGKNFLPNFGTIS